jgi:hypothetical protein
LLFLPCLFCFSCFVTFQPDRAGCTM